MWSSCPEQFMYNYICTFVLLLCVCVMQNLGEIPNLHGVEEDPTISEEIDIRVRGYRAFR